MNCADERLTLGPTEAMERAFTVAIPEALDLRLSARASKKKVSFNVLLAELLAERAKAAGGLVNWLETFEPALDALSEDEAVSCRMRLPEPQVLAFERVVEGWPCRTVERRQQFFESLFRAALRDLLGSGQGQEVSPRPASRGVG